MDVYEYEYILKDKCVAWVGMVIADIKLIELGSEIFLFAYLSTISAYISNTCYKTFW